MTCTYDPYTLPPIYFVGGETQQFAFHVYFHDKSKPVGMSGCECSFAVVSFTNRRGAPILKKSMTVIANEDNTVDNVLTVTIPSEDTVNLDGKYIYQISIKDMDGDTDIPRQGILYIANNIDKKFITE